MRRLISRPWLHFLLLGFTLFYLEARFNQPPLPTINPPTAERLTQLRGQWLRSTGRPATAQEEQQLITHEINQELLFQHALRLDMHRTDPVVMQRLVRDMRFVNASTEASDQQLFESALEMGLHENDLVVRRRMIQRLEMQAQAGIRNRVPDEQQLIASYEDNKAAYIRPATIDFQHVYVSRDKHAKAEQRARQQLAALRSGVQAATSLSDPFLHGLQFQQLSLPQLARYFGAQFGEELEQQMAAVGGDNKQQAVGEWLGPIVSSYGYHLVLVTKWVDPKQKTLAEVRPQLEAQWRRAQELRAVEAMVQRLRKEYGLDE